MRSDQARPNAGRWCQVAAPPWEGTAVSEAEIMQTVGLNAAALDSDYPAGMHWTDLASFKADFIALQARTARDGT